MYEAHESANATAKWRRCVGARRCGGARSLAGCRDSCAYRHRTLAYQFHLVWLRGPVGPSRSRTSSSTAVCRRTMRAQMSAGTPATSPSNARFVSVSVRPVTLPTILPAAFFGGANTVTTAASAVAGFDQVVCGVTPVYVCNPYETAGMTYDQQSIAVFWRSR
jgi:hypothetical protein